MHKFYLRETAEQMEAQAGEGKPLLATIKYLRENGIEALTKEFALSTCRHEQHPHLVQIKYDQVQIFCYFVKFIVP